MYIVLYILLFILYFYLKNNIDTNKARKVFIYIATIILSIFSALRHLAVGNDTYAYYMSFESAIDVSWSTIFTNIRDYWHGVALKDPGYDIIEKGFHYFSNEFVVYQFAIAVLFLSAIGHIVYRNVNTLFGCVISYSFYISLFYSYLPNSATRQTIAMGMLLWAIVLWIEKKYKFLPFAIIIFASLIHKSVLLGFIPIVIYYIRCSHLIYKYAIFISLIVFVFGQPIAQYMATVSAAEQYMGYVQADYYAGQAKPITFIIEMVVFYFIGFFTKKSNREHSKYAEFYTLCFSLAICFISFIWVNPNLMRVIAYFSIWGIAFIPNVLERHYAYYKTILYTLVILLTVGRSVLALPQYKFYWQEMQLNERFY